MSSITHGHPLPDSVLDDKMMTNRVFGCGLPPGAQNTRSTFLPINQTVHAAFAIPRDMNHCYVLEVPLEQTVHKFSNCSFIQNDISYMYYEL